jgi:hypothetical protein
MKILMKPLAVATVSIAMLMPAKAVKVRDIIEFHAAIPACLDIEDTYQLRIIQARTRNGFGDETLYGRVLIDQYVAETRAKTGANTSSPVCQWFYAGEVRYVAEKRPTDRGGFRPATDSTNVGTGRGGAYFCMGWLVGQTKNEDHSKPCLWVHMADLPTSNLVGRAVQQPRYEWPNETPAQSKIHDYAMCLKPDNTPEPCPIRTPW